MSWGLDQLDDGFWETFKDMGSDLGGGYDTAISSAPKPSSLLSYGTTKAPTTMIQQMGKMTPQNPMLPGGTPMAPSGYRSLFGTPFEGFRGR